MENTITPERAEEILKNIRNAPFGWHRDRTKDFERGIMTEDEHREILRKWLSMPGYTCYADALHRLARGE